ncbi:IS66 family transposase [Candidatus Pacearchaeota archaeon]|nr:IS66 family transposase [Candidatus Pacearchaeota archaeon]
MELEKEIVLLKEENQILRKENKKLKREIKRSIEELRKIVHHQAIEIVELTKENDKLRNRVNELEGKQKEKPNFIKDPIDTIPKKSGQKKGHTGYSRNIPERIDEIKPLDMEECPDCGERLSGIQDVRSRVITDIEVKVKNTQYIIHRRYCKNCGKIVEPEVVDVLPHARFGLKFMLLVMVMKIGLRMPSQSVVDWFKIFSLEISDGEIYKILNQLKTAFGDYYQGLVVKIKKAKHKHIDETSWRIDGQNFWMWDFINKEIALYVIEKSRGSKVPIEVLGNQEGKCCTTDRFSAYNVLVTETGIIQQVCWTHLLRNSKDLAEFRSEAKYIHKRMKYVYKKAIEGKTSKEKLLHWIDLIAPRTYTSNEVFKFVKSVCRDHREDLFRFVDNPEIEATNNHAERGLRHPVVMRKISGGSRSNNGADTTAKLLSIMQTMKMQDGNVLDNMINILQEGK